jgi:Protein of unknown function (DUF2934)
MSKSKSPKKLNGDATIAPVTTATSPVLPVQTTAAPATPEPKKIASKPALVKNEGRANLVPINVDEEIRSLAYLLSERRGFEPGHEAEDWLTAEREIRLRYHQQSA